MTIPVLPETPTDLASARTYLAWIADASLRVQIPRDAALAATKAVEAWVRVENYNVQLRSLEKRIKELQARVAG